MLKEYRQRAKAESSISNSEITALDLINKEMDTLKNYINYSIKSSDRDETDKLRTKLLALKKAQNELDTHYNTENDLLLRDVYDVERRDPLKTVSGKKFREFEISSNKRLRIRLLHPDKPEHISGADIIYECHNLKNTTIRLAAVQYKLWEKKQLYDDGRMGLQLNKLYNLLCNKNMCSCSGNTDYRFPCCSAFLRPTDKIQKGNQKLLSSGLHVPLCKIHELWEEGPRGIRANLRL